MKKTVWIFVLALLGSGTGRAGSGFNKAGRTALQFLKIGIGARPAALGEACIANMEDVTAVFWNPAAITGLKSGEASFTYTKWFGDLHFSSGAVGCRAGGAGVFAVHYVALDYGQIQEALVSAPGGGADTRTGNLFGGNDLSVGLSYAAQYTDKLSIGLSVKYVREKLFTYASSTWAFDVGSYFKTGWKGIRLAMSAQNLSRPARWMQGGSESQQTFELPIVFRIGWSIDLLGGDDLFLGGSPDRHRLSFNMDAIHTNDYAERLHMGAEYTAFNLFMLRAGYRFNHEEGRLGFGAGIRIRSGSLLLHLDYAYVNYDFLDSPHRISISVQF
ncbi:PorV/PorQ family protein [bacterium]|nr:PorV/PorQ family protein [bacterium]